MSGDRLTHAWPRWEGDTWPGLLEAAAQAAKAEADAWEAVAKEAQREANAARGPRIHYRRGANLPALIAAAKALIEPAEQAWRVARRAEDAWQTRTARTAP